MKHIFCVVVVFALFVSCAQAVEVPFIEIQGYASSDNYASIAFFPDGKKFVAGSRITRIYDVSGKELQTLVHENDIVYFVAVSPDGKRIITAGANYVSDLEDPIIRIWDVESGEVIQKIEGLFGAISPDRMKVVTTGWDIPPGRLWDTESGKELKKLEGYTGFTHSAAFSPDGKKLVTINTNGITQVWNTESGKELKKLDRHRFWYFSPDGKKIASSRFFHHIFDKTTSILDSESEKELLEIEGQFGTFSADGKVIVTRSRERVGSQVSNYIFQIWDAESGKEMQKLVWRSSPIVHTVVLSPDGKKIVAIRYRGRDAIKIWDTESGKELYTLGHDRGEFRSGSAVVFSPDGKILVTACGGTIRIWTLE